MTDQAALAALLDEALADSDAAPLSLRRAMLVVMLADRLVDQLARGEGGDPLRARTDIGARSRDLALVLEIAAHRDGGPRLVVEPVEVALSDYETLSTADFMVSLYDEHTVPRLLVALPEGGRLLAREVLRGAVAAVRSASR